MLEQNAIVIQDVVMIDEKSQLPVKALTVFFTQFKAIRKRTDERIFIHSAQEKQE
ncbi:MAG: hypothetical protein K2P32_03395 [Clostridia bacterium]|nr:hypothetical protein [Clostridia bacterium]